jgi:carbon-monoxide dehydrogenase large subunit
VLARDTVRHVGDAIAFVVAETVAGARDALEAIEVEYEVLPAVIDAVRRCSKGPPRYGARRRSM